VKAAYAILRQVQKDAYKIRDSFLEDRAEHLAETQNTTEVAALQQLLRAEKQAAIFRRLGLWFKDDEYTKLDRLMVPNDPQDMTATWSTIIEAAALFDVLTTDGRNHFRQAAHSLCNRTDRNQTGPLRRQQTQQCHPTGHIQCHLIDRCPGGS
jgi:hypothetical protein